MGLRIIIFLFLGLFFLLMPNKSFAQYIAPQAVPTSQINISKMVKNPQTNQFVKNLSFSDPHFLPGQEVVFQLTVTNGGQTDLTNTQVKDKFPDIVDFVSGPGNFDMNSQTLNFTIDKLSAGQSKSFEVHVKVKQSTSLPANTQTCLTNFAEARVNQLVSQDTSVFCIETKVLGVTQEIPKTGPSNALIIATVSISLLGTSIYLFRKYDKERG